MNLEDITVQQLKEKMDLHADKIFVLDVREPYEYDAYNIGVTLIPLGELPERIEELRPYADKEILIHCRSGKRSDTAKHFLLANGFTKVSNVLGGMLAWEEAFGK